MAWNFWPRRQLFFSNRTAALAQICFQRYFADDFELDKNKRCAQSVILLWLQLNEMFLAGEWVFTGGFRTMRASVSGFHDMLLLGHPSAIYLSSLK